MPAVPVQPVQSIENKAKLAVSGIGLSTRLAIAMVVLVLVTAAVLSLITYHAATTAAIPGELDRLATKAKLNASKLEAALNSARQDMVMVQGGVAVSQLIVTRAAVPFVQETETRIRENIAARFSAIMSAKPEYAQLRIIGVPDGGRELIRVNRSGPAGGVRVIPDPELRQMGERDFFKPALGQPGANVYVSPVMLQKDIGTGRPAGPILYLAIALRTPVGQPCGIGLLDFDLGPKLDGFRAEKADKNLVLVANAAGEYLLRSDPSREFAFDTGTKARLQDDFPKFDPALAGAGSGIWTDRAGEKFGVGWERVGLAGGPAITVLVAAKYSDLNVGWAAVRGSVLTGGLVAVLLALLVAVAIARSLSRPLVQITNAVKGMSRGELIQLPSGGGEIGVLAAAFGEMATQLRTKQALLENTIASIRDSVLVADEHGQIVLANEAAERLLGIVPGDGVTRKFNYFYPDGVTPMPVSELARARALRGECVDDEEFVVEPESPCVPAHIVANARPLKDQFGNLRGAVTVFRNVTENKRAHQSLVDSEKMAQAIVNTALDAFVQTDETGLILDWSPNAEAMLGWTRSQALGANAYDLIVPEMERETNRERYTRFLLEVDDGATGWRFEAPLLHRDGSEVLTEMSVTALRRGDSYIINTFIRNISQKRAAEEQLIQAQKMESVGQLTGGIAHDFNNMLTVITGTIEILAAAVKDDPHLARITTLISEAADRGSELTANLLAFARKQPLQPIEVDVNALVNEVARLLAPTLGRQIEIETAPGADLWAALVDPGQLSSALVNLAINARDAMPDGGTLMLATRNIALDMGEAAASGVAHPGNYVLIEVSDSGSGIPEAILDRIFEPFFSTKDTGQGTGLGLSMVFGFAKQSGGNVVVRSAEGHGTTFKIYLPKADGEASGLPLEDRSQSPGGTETILCVEDDASVRAYVIAQLGSLGYKVIVACNAAEALAIAEEGAEFDLLFTDIVMPGKMNGKQLAEKMRQQRPSLKVLFTSGYSYDTIIRDGRLVPNVLFLAKPYRRAELARMLRRSLEEAAAVSGVK